MADWITVDYGDTSTWPTHEQLIQGLRWWPTDHDDGMWMSLWGRAHTHGAQGFSIQGIDRPGLTSAGTLRREADWPEKPDAPTDWWRPLEEPDAVR